MSVYYQPARKAGKRAAEFTKLILDLQAQGKKIIHMTLIGQYFDQIALGQKLEEYRGIKYYWGTRLYECKFFKDEETGEDLAQPIKPKHFDFICFHHGYSAGHRQMLVEYDGVEEGYGQPDWGADPEQLYYVISLGKVTNTNYK